MTLLSFLDPKKYYILHDLRIPYKDSFFQIDTLLITTKFILNMKSNPFRHCLFRPYLQSTYSNNRWY
ncbi:MAG: nuclease-related domain-containing protein [Bacillota bacterium]